MNSPRYKSRPKPIWTVAYLTLLAFISLGARASEVTAGNFLIEVPDGWSIKREKPETLSAGPNGEAALPQFSANVCDRASSQCLTRCKPEEVRRDYFNLFPDMTSFEFTKHKRLDGDMEYGAWGRFDRGEGPTQVGMTVICSSRGIVLLGLMSKEPPADVKALLMKIASKSKWKP